MPKAKSGHGGHRWSKPQEQHRIRINVTLAPDVIRLLQPYVPTGERGRKIDEAVRAYLRRIIAPEHTVETYWETNIIQPEQITDTYRKEARDGRGQKKEGRKRKSTRRPHQDR